MKYFSGARVIQIVNKDLNGELKSIKKWLMLEITDTNNFKTMTMPKKFGTYLQVLKQ